MAGEPKKRRKNGNSAREYDRPEEVEPIPTGARWALGIIAALIPTVFLALGSFIWTTNNKVVVLQETVENMETRTEDRYTKADAIEDHEREEKTIDQLRQRINQLAEEVHFLKGVHEAHKRVP